MNEHDEPTSDMYHMTMKHKSGKVRPKTEASGGADLRYEIPEPLNYEVRQRFNSQVNEQMAGWLDQLAPWDWFSTYTFSELTSAEGAHHMFRIHLGWLEKKAGIPIYAFRADEYGAQRGRLHIHALIGNVARLTAFCGERYAPGTWGRPCCGLHGWPCGIARVLPYDPAIGATGYVTKYVTKDFGDYELIGIPEAVPQPVLRPHTEGHA